MEGGWGRGGGVVGKRKNKREKEKRAKSEKKEK